jgi:Putative Ig domain
MNTTTFFSSGNMASIKSSMLQIAGKIGFLILLAWGSESAFGFALLGPVNEPYQGGQPQSPAASGGGPNELDYNFPGDIGAPKNIGEEYRRNTPTLYYAFDRSFLDYFGTNGITAIEQAFAILNSLDNVSSYSADLSEFPLEAQRVNDKAQALQLVDLKSAALHLLVEEMGLAEPDRYTWTLHNRFLPPGAQCPQYIYSVIKRNFDPVTSEPSSYVNGTLYSYNILEFCPTPSRADAVEFLVDPLSIPFTAVASLGGLVNFSPITETDEGVARFGFFYTGLTRDDVGGLRYLLRTNNMNIERSSAGLGGFQSQTFQFVTNENAQLLVGSNVTLLAAQALTNNAAALQALYPDLVITSTTNLFVRGFITNVIPFFTNAPWDPVGTPPHLGFVTNRIPFAQTQFRHTFGNLVTFQFINGQWVTVPVGDITALTRPQIILSQTATVAAQNAPWTPVGTTNIVIATNVTTRVQLTNTPSGEFFILPTNLCDIAILGSFLTNIIASTNIIATTTNTAAGTNVAGTLAFTQSEIDFFTNHSFIVDFITCETNTVADRQGIERIKFVRTGRLGEVFFDPDFIPVTNVYNLTAVTNGQTVKQTIKRVINQPDIIFSAQDLVGPSPGGPFGIPVAARTYFTNGTVDLTTIIPGLAGPGIIEPSLDITFNKVGPIFVNSGPSFIDEASALFVFQFGSFDGTTNDPIVYPSGSSIRDLENGVLMQIIAPPAIAAAVGPFFTLQLDGSGGQPPYSWDIASGSLPPGLTLSPSGVISGNPTTAGNYEATVEITDSRGLSAQRQLNFVISN